MIIIDDVLISLDVVEEHFVCQLDACKGACCYEGDFGAPLEKEELEILENIYPQIAPFLTEAGRKAIAEQGVYTFFKEDDTEGTTLLENGACAYMTYDELGIARCGMEAAFLAGKTKFKKPISCHLYPIRIHAAPEQHFEALNYDRWSICAAACQNGKALKIPVYQFVKDALIRKYGEAFYNQLDAAARHLSTSASDD